MILNVILMIVSVALIIVCLLQSGKSEGVVNALTGQGSDQYKNQKERGFDLILSRITVGLAIVFFVVAILIRMG